MRNLLILASVSFVLLVLAAPSAYTGADEVTPPYFLEGYVAETGRTPMEGVTVTVTDSDGNVFGIETSADGYFKVGASAGPNLVISFSRSGYTTVMCPNTSIDQTSGFFILNLSKAPYNSSARTYTITGSVADMQCALMAVASDVTVAGQVSYDRNPVKNAAVALTPSEGGEAYSAHTNDRGQYEIVCPQGAYTLTVTAKGFSDSDSVPVNVTSNPPTFNVTMEKSDLKKYLGLDAAHILMLVGVIVCIVLAISAWFLSKRMNGPHRLEIFDDSAEDDDGLRYP